jgi:hypothetical protein
MFLPDPYKGTFLPANRLVINNIPIGKITSESNVDIKEMNHQNTSEIEELTNKNKKFNILNDLKYWKNDGINSIKYKKKR